MNYPDIYETVFKPYVPGDFENDQANQAVQELAEHGFVVASGLHDRDNLQNDLLGMAREPHIVEFCPNDRSENRFQDRETTRRWLGKNGGRGFVAIYATPEDRLSDEQIRTASADNVRMVAYGWSGLQKEQDQHIPGTDIATGYRVGAAGRQLSFERRHRGGDRFKLGMPLGRMVLATAIERHLVEPSRINLETWKSNLAAVGLYKQLGFERPEHIPEELATRPTLQAVGDLVNGRSVYHGRDAKGNFTNMVRDYRIHMRFNPDAYPRGA